METYLSLSFEGNRGEFNGSEILNSITLRSHASGAGRLHRDVTAFSYFHLPSFYLLAVKICFAVLVIRLEELMQPISRHCLWCNILYLSFSKSTILFERINQKWQNVTAKCHLIKNNIALHSLQTLYSSFISLDSRWLKAQCWSCHN